MINVEPKGKATENCTNILKKEILTGNNLKVIIYFPAKHNLFQKIKAEVNYLPRLL